MAANPATTLHFAAGCPDCGQRQAGLPQTLAKPGDDFDWNVRDYDGFRLFMMQELAARFPERTRWTPADVEVASIEVLSTVLDQLSDSLDRVAAEAFLETARQPASVRRLLSLIGYDAITKSAANTYIPDANAPIAETDKQRRCRLLHFHAPLQRNLGDYQSIVSSLSDAARTNLQAFIDQPQAADNAALQALQGFLDAAPAFVLRAQQQALETYWLQHPYEMDRHRRAGPREIHIQQRMVTADDYARQLEQHPLCNRATAWTQWSGSWNSIHIAVLNWQNTSLDDVVVVDTAIRTNVDCFHRKNNLPAVAWQDAGNHNSSSDMRLILRQHIDAWRMAGQEVLLSDALAVGISMSISLQIKDHYFQSEVRMAIHAALGTAARGFFAPGRLQFGEDLHAGDIYETLMALDGIKAVCLNRFKRIGRQFPDASETGIIELNNLEIARCDQNAARSEYGNYRLHLHGGRKG